MDEAAGIALLRELDGFSDLRHKIGKLARARELWSGMPMPLDDLPLVIEPSYPGADKLMAFYKDESDDDMEGVVFRNRFYSVHRRSDVYVFHEPREGGRVRHGMIPAFHAGSYIVKTIGASAAWGIEQERRALDLLGTLLRHHQFKSYLLTGCFIESSKRSGLTYIFRKLRPTIVIDARAGSRTYQIGSTETTPCERIRVLCCLCMHPIGYYAESWAGSMCPTDDVVAHLMLMRGDEPMLWRRANQHAPHRPEAGL